MADRTYRPKEAASKLATRERTYALVIVCGLWKDDITVDESTPIATVLEHECDFDGYARAIDVVLDTQAALGSTAFLNLAHIMAQFVFSAPSDPPVSNNAAGMFVLVQVDDSPLTYEVFTYTNFDGVISMGAVGDVIEKVVSEVIPN